MTWIPNQVWNDEQLLLLFLRVWTSEHRSPVGTDMIDVFLYLGFQFSDIFEWAIVADDIHDLHVDCLSVDIFIEIDDMDFEMPFLDLVRTSTEKQSLPYFDTA